MKPPKLPLGYTGYDSENRFCPDPSLINPNAIYEPPVKTLIGKIPVVIVDPHHEVFPFWYRKDHEPIALVHIDNHSDTCANIPTLEELAEHGIKPTIDQYTKDYLNIATFIAPALYYKLINAVYWLDPINLELCKLDSNIYEENGKIRFNLTNPFPKAYRITPRDLANEINNKFILDLDLDAFECVEEPAYWRSRRFSFGSIKIQRFLRKRIINKRFSQTKKLLHLLPTPEIITIATSQTPITTTPPENVGYLELKTLDMLEELYQR